MRMMEVNNMDDNIGDEQPREKIVDQAFEDL